MRDVMYFATAEIAAAEASLANDVPFVNDADSNFVPGGKMGVEPMKLTFFR